MDKNPDKYVTVYLHKSVLDILKEGRDATNPDMTVEDYIEHLAAMHQKVRQLKEQEGYRDDQKDHS